MAFNPTEHQLPTDVTHTFQEVPNVGEFGEPPSQFSPYYYGRHRYYGRKPEANPNLVMLNIKEESENGYLDVVKKVHDKYLLKKIIFESNKNYVEHYLVGDNNDNPDEFSYLKKIIIKEEELLQKLLTTKNKRSPKSDATEMQDIYRPFMRRYRYESCRRRWAPAVNQEVVDDNSGTKDKQEAEAENENKINVAKILQEKYQLDIAEYIASRKNMNERCNKFVMDHLNHCIKLNKVFRMISDQLEYTCLQNDFSSNESDTHLTAIVEERQKLFEKYNAESLIDQWVETRNIIFYLLDLLTSSTSKKYEHECPICKESKADLRTCDPCGHIFCSSCLKDIVDDTCPICREFIMKQIKLRFC